MGEVLLKQETEREREKIWHADYVHVMQLTWGRLCIFAAWYQKLAPLFSLNRQDRYKTWYSDGELDCEEHCWDSGWKNRPAVCTLGPEPQYCEPPCFKNISLRWTSLPRSPSLFLNGQPTTSENTTETAVQEKLIRLQFAEQIDINKGGNGIQGVSQWCLLKMGGRAPVFCPKQTSR